MRILHLISFLIVVQISLCQTSGRTITITMKNFICNFRDDMKPTAEKAFRIASAIFNSSEFQEEISNMSFRCDGYCEGCKSINLNSQGRISGDEVLNKLFIEPNVAITLDLKEKGSALGETSEGSYYTTAWYKNIQDDMSEFKFDFAYALAVNLCHEYMHQVGFCHVYCTGWRCSKKNRLNEPNGNPDPKFISEDITYKVGWAAFYLLEKWHKNKKVIE